jgi:hypothetical protein
MGEPENTDVRLARIEERVAQLRTDVNAIRKTTSTIVMLLVGAIVVAIINFVIGGGLAPPP